MIGSIRPRAAGQPRATADIRATAPLRNLPDSRFPVLGHCGQWVAAPPTAAMCRLPVIQSQWPNSSASVEQLHLILLRWIYEKNNDIFNLHWHDQQLMQPLWLAQTAALDQTPRTPQICHPVQPQHVVLLRCLEFGNSLPSAVLRNR